MRLAAASLPSADPVHKVSIIPRSIGALGYTMQRPTDDRFLITERDLKERMVVLLAGRAAEELVFGEVSTGAADDLGRVTDIARQIVTRFGMDKALGQAVFERQSSSYLGDSVMGIKQRDYSEQTAREIDMAVKALIDEAYGRSQGDPEGAPRRPHRRGQAAAGEGDDHARGLPPARPAAGQAGGGVAHP
jgi:cell division protease FtsH